LIAGLERNGRKNRNTLNLCHLNPQKDREYENLAAAQEESIWANINQSNYLD
jgi:hypothetical protein